MRTKNDDAAPGADELREHDSFDYSMAKPNRFADLFSEEAIAVVLNPDVAAVFPTSKEAMRAFLGQQSVLEVAGPEFAPGDAVVDLTNDAAATLLLR